MTLYKNYWLLSSFCMTFFTIPYWPLMPSEVWLVICSLLLIFSCVFSQLRWISGISVALILIIAKGNVVEFQQKHLFYYGQNITITGKVDSFFKQNNFGFRGIIQVHQVNNYQFPSLLRPRVLLYVANDLKLNEIIQLDVKLKPILGLKNEVGFDAEKYYFSQNILAKAFAKKQGEVSFSAESSNFRSWLHKEFTERVVNLENHGLALAISFADRTGLTNQDWEYLKTSGLAHLVAISGLHIGIAYLLGSGLGGVLVRTGKVSLWLPSLSGIFVAFLYTWLAGFSVATTRALIMVIINVGLSSLRIKVSVLYRLLITLALVLCYAPFALFSSSFWLSFIAVTLVFVNGQMTSKCQSRILRLIVTNTLMSLVMMPVSAWFFGGVSLFSGLYNFVFIPLFTFIIIPLLFLLLIVTMLQIHSIEPIWLLWDHLLGLVPVFAQYSQNYWVSVSFVHTLLMLVALSVIFFRIPLSNPSFLLMTITTIAVFLGWEKPKDHWSIDILDVGQGSAMLIQKNNNYILYDTGKSWPGGSIAESVISPLLTYKGLRRLDGLIISHIDNDHAGGEQDIINSWQPKWTLSSRLSSDNRQCVAGQHWEWQELLFSVIWPEVLVAVPGNSDSCVVRVSDKFGHSVLLTGDVDKNSEWVISRKNPDIQSDIVIVPHHGSNTSSSSDFIAATRPTYAIASLARDNPWHFPKPSVVEKYNQVNAKWLDTGHSGQIHITFYPEKYQIETQRSMKGDPWYRQMLRKKVE